jgi:hypothetical protein
MKHQGKIYADPAIHANSSRYQQKAPKQKEKNARAAKSSSIN